MPAKELVVANEDGTIDVNGFAGINNVDRPERLSLADLHEAVNVDIDKTGGIARRVGRIARYTGTNLRSLWSNDKVTLFAEGATQRRLIRDVNGAITSATVRSIGANASLCYTEINEDVVCSDGQDLWRVRDGVASALTDGVVLQRETDSGGRLEEKSFAVMPGGSILAYYKGCLWVARGNVVYRSRPLLYGYHMPSKDFVAFPSEVRVMIGLDNAIFFVTDSGHYVITGGGEEDYVFSQKHDYGAPKSSAVRVPVSVISPELGDGTAAMWVSNKGFMFGLPSGQIINLTEKRVALPQYDKVALMYRERAGLRQVVASAPSKGGVGSFAIGDSAEAEVRRNGVIIN